MKEIAGIIIFCFVVIAGMIVMSVGVVIIIEKMTQTPIISQQRPVAEIPATIDTKQTADTKTYAARVTAYCPCEKCCGQFADGITASGHRIRPGDKFCASPLPFLTVLNIPGYGVVPVLDRGGAIKEDCIDVFFPTHETALLWGVQYLTVAILK